MARKESKKPKTNVEEALGWLGRQIGHVRRAVKSGGKSGAKSAQRQVVHREKRVQEAAMPARPGMVLRRTVIDEVIVQDEGSRNREEDGGSNAAGAQPGSGAGSLKKSHG